LSDVRIAALTAYSTLYTAGYLCIIKGTITDGKILADDLSVEFNDVAIATTLDFSVTTDTKVASFPNNPADAIANTIFERYYLTDKSIISLFSSNLAKANINTAINTTANLTSWGTQTGATGSLAIQNGYGYIRVGDYLFGLSFDTARISKISIDEVGMPLVGKAEWTAPTGYTGYGQALTYHNGKLFALFNAVDSLWSPSADYLGSTLIEVDPGVGNAAPQFVTANAVTVGKNSVKIVADGDYLYVPAIGGPQKTAESNADSSIISRIHVNNGVLETPEIAYKGDGTTDYYDIKDISVGQTAVLVHLGRIESTSAPYPVTFVLVRIPIANFRNAVDANITSLFDDPNLIEFDLAYGGMWYTADYEKAFDHHWAGLSQEIHVYDDLAIADFNETPTPKIFTAADFYGGVAPSYVNSLDLLVDSTSTHATRIADVFRGLGLARVAGGSLHSAHSNVANKAKASLIANINKLKELNKAKKT
jgi:hypothetical protein